MLTGQPLQVVGQDRVVQLVPGDSVTIAPATGPASAYIGPGWVDLHAHVYDGMTSLSVHPDRVGLATGVHLLADAGSSGAATVDGLARYIRPSATTGLRAWLNIGSHGLVDLRETADIRLIDIDGALAAIERHRDLICGIKVRSSGAIVGEMGLLPLQLGRLVARTAGLPLLVHIGEAPPLIEDVLDLLGAGDVITHCFHGKVGGPWQPDGRPVPALARALDRGVLLDVGHGAASFSFAVAERAIAAGFAPHSISTDIHIRNINGPVYGLAATMTKLLACGMPLPDVIAAVTTTPRRVLRIDDCALATAATLFRLSDTGPECRDATGERRCPDRHIVPAGTLVAGTLRPCRAV